MRLLFAGLVLAGLMLAPGRPAAHAMPGSTVVLTIGAEAVDADVSIPLSELGAAVGRPLAADDLAPARPGLDDYLRRHIAVLAPDGRAWALQFVRMEALGGDHPMMTLVLRLEPPPGAPTRRFQLRYDAVNHEVASHYVLVYLRDPRRGGVARPAGRLQSPAVSMVIDQDAP